MKRHQTTILLTLLVAAGGSQAADGPGHCAPNEITHFNCDTGGRVASLCGAPDGSVDYLQFRFGPPEDEPEWVVPALTDDPEMGRTFYYTISDNQDAMLDKIDVWFRHQGNSWAVEVVEHYDSEGIVTRSEPVILMWEGVPQGAPHAFRCVQTDSGATLYGAERVIEAISAPDHDWSRSPLECAWVTGCSGSEAE